MEGPKETYLSQIFEYKLKSSDACLLIFHSPLCSAPDLATSVYGIKFTINTHMDAGMSICAGRAAQTPNQRDR